MVFVCVCVCALVSVSHVYTHLELFQKGLGLEEHVGQQTDQIGVQRRIRGVGQRLVKRRTLRCRLHDVNTTQHNTRTCHIR